MQSKIQSAIFLFPKFGIWLMKNMQFEMGLRIHDLRQHDVNVNAKIFKYMCIFSVRFMVFIQPWHFKCDVTFKIISFHFKQCSNHCFHCKNLKQFTKRIRLIHMIGIPICNNKTIMNTCFSTMLIFLKMLYDYSSTAYVVVYTVR